MSARSERERTNRSMLRVRDTLDRDFAQPLDIAELAQRAAMSPDHLIRTFKRVFGETPHRYLQRRRLERAMALLREADLSVTEICLAVGYSSLGAFSELFTSVVSCSPSEYRVQASDGASGPTTGFVMAWTRPSTFTHQSISRKRDVNDGA